VKAWVEKVGDGVLSGADVLLLAVVAFAVFHCVFQLNTFWCVWCLWILASMGEIVRN